MAHDKVYGICENKCFVEVSPKTDVEQAQATADSKVSKGGDTMSGNLTIQRASTPSIGIRATEGSYGDVLFYDSGSNRSAFVRGEHTSDYNRLILGCSNPNGNTLNYTMQLYNHATEGVYVLAPTPSSATDSSDKIATTSWVNNIDNDVVHKSRAEIITGTKTFSTTILSNKASGQVFTSKFSEYASGDTLENTLEHTIRFEDKKAKNLGHLIYVLYKDGRRHLGLTALNHNSAYAGLGITVNADGTFSSEAPSTPTNATSNEIATARWVNSKLAYEEIERLSPTISIATWKIGNIRDGALISGYAISPAPEHAFLPFTAIYTGSTQNQDLAVSGNAKLTLVQGHLWLVETLDDGSVRTCTADECILEGHIINF